MVNSPGCDAKRFFVVGCGSIGKRHIKNLYALGVRQLFAFDVSAERRADVGSSLGIETIDKIEAGWERKPDAVLVATPTSMHVAIALEAASRGCHLFIEKPLSNSWEGVQCLLDVVAKNDLTTLVGCNMRFHPGLVAIKRLLAEQAVGHVIAARVEVGQYLPDWHPWEDYRRSYSARRELGGGIILDAIHEIDYIRWLLGEVSSATCVADKLSGLEIDTEDTAAILMRFVTGALGEVHLDYVQRAYRRTCQIIGEEGTIHWDYGSGQVRWYTARSQRWQIETNPSGWEVNQMYLDEMNHWLACLSGEAKPFLDVFEATRVLQIAFAAKRSAEKPCWIDLGGPSCNSN